MSILLIIACVCAIVIILIFTLLYLLIAIDELPQPSGQWAVGTSEIVWDTPDYPPGIIAKIWYPIDRISAAKSP